MIRDKAPQRDWSGIIWNKHIIFIIKLRLFSGGWSRELFRWILALNKGVWWRLLSASVVGILRKKELIIFFFIQIFIAGNIWKHYGDIFRILNNHQSICALIKGWTHDFSRQSQLGIISLAVVAYGCYGIWKERCRSIFEDVQMNASTIITYIQQSIKTVNIGLQNNMQATTLGNIILEHLQLTAKPHRMIRGKWVRWIPPDGNTFKLNVDGSRRTTQTAGGGLLRDQNGNAIFAFSSFYGDQSTIQSELQAIMEGLQICRQRGIHNLIIESDSMLAVNMITAKMKDAWEVSYLIRRCRNLMQDDWSISHIFREQNAVADRLAQLAYNHKTSKVFHSYHDLDVIVRHDIFIFMDKMGLPKYRHKT